MLIFERNNEDPIRGGSWWQETNPSDTLEGRSKAIGRIEPHHEYTPGIFEADMRIALGCDHGGFPLKNRVISVIEHAGHQVVDFGTDSNCSVDYPDFAKAVGIAILAGQADRAILICGSGAGICVAANKIPGIRAGVCHDVYTAHQAVEHDDLNVLCLGARVIGEEVAIELVKSFLGAVYSHEERHQRRLNKVLLIEQEALAGRFSKSGSASS